jgi:hypothetical protein
MIPVALVLPASGIGKALMIGSVLLVLIVELLNSAVEAAIDRISLDRPPALQARQGHRQRRGTDRPDQRAGHLGLWCCCRAAASSPPKERHFIHEPHGHPLGSAKLGGSQHDDTLHIAIVTETYPPEVNGVAMTLGRMVQGLLARGHRVSLDTPAPACRR